MLKDILYGGLSAQPSDPISGDGELASAINLVPEDGALVPTLPAKHRLKILNGEKLLLIHKLAQQTNYIFLKIGRGGCNLLWQKDSPDFVDTSDLNPLGHVDGVKDITIVGNTLVVASYSGTVFFLWKGNEYRQLSKRPPFITMEFACMKIGNFEGTSETPSFDTSDPEFYGDDGLYDKNAFEAFKDSIYGPIWNNAERIGKLGWLWQPFMARYAYRLYDGSYSWHSSPILILPVCHSPLVINDGAGMYAGTSHKVKNSVCLNSYFSLQYRCLQFDKTELENWSDIVKGIDVFISAPIYTFDQKETGYNRVPIHEAIVRDGTDFSTSVRPETEDLFIGHFGVGVFKPGPIFVMDEPKDQYLTIAHYGLVTDKNVEYNCAWQLSMGDFHKRVREVNAFYKVHSFELSEIESKDEFQSLEMGDVTADFLVTKPILPDESDSHCDIHSEVLFSYNNRLNYADVSIMPAKPLPLLSLVQFNNESTKDKTNVRVKVWSRREGVEFCTYNDYQEYCDIEGCFPRYIYVADPNAYKLALEQDNKTWVLPLRQHEFLNGAYYYNETLTKDALPTSTLEPGTAGELLEPIRLMNRVYVSEVNNPFVIPSANKMSVGQGHVLGLCSAVKALSQGQFGQFPLYAFTDEGVWSIEIANDGSYSARQPITRDVCINPDSITQIDSAVLFASNRGIMLLSGSDTTCISDNLDSEKQFSLISDMPLAEKVLDASGLTVDDVQTIPFKEFIQECRMIYDYTNQRIIVFRSDCRYAYVYSLKSKQWGMMQSNFKEPVNSYPEALATDNDDNVVNFSQTDATGVKGLIVTRPIKLEPPHALKTVDTIIQRGYFRKGHVKCVLYGSRDLFKWFPIYSSQDHYLRGFRGTPYKYFRLALICDFQKDENVIGCTVQWEPRYLNQPR